MGLAFILMQIKSPMLVSVGMYLPIETSFAIFAGGIFKGILDHISEKRKLADEDKDKANNTGTLLASGLIAGEALTGILFAVFNFAEIPIPKIFSVPSYLPSLVGMIILGAVLVIFSLRRLNNKIG
jgi:uncharacterized oligopeptide transporter (OPT) family protein